MKKTRLFISIFILLFSVVCSDPSCKKSASRCENWVIQDFCIKKTPQAKCLDYVRRVETICDGDLDDAQSGRITQISEDANIRVERHYIKKAL